MLAIQSSCERYRFWVAFHQLTISSSWDRRDRLVKGEPAVKGDAEHLDRVGNLDQGPVDIDRGRVMKSSCTVIGAKDYCFGFGSAECSTVVQGSNMEGQWDRARVEQCEQNNCLWISERIVKYHRWYCCCERLKELTLCNRRVIEGKSMKPRTDDCRTPVKHWVTEDLDQPMRTLRTLR